MDSVFFLGASGQTGGAFLTVFRKTYPDIPITVYLRSSNLDTALSALGNVTIVHGPYSDLAAIEKLAFESSIVINAAHSRDVPLTEAVLRGTRTRKTQTKKNSILIHLSGAGNFVDNSQTGGFIPQEHPFNDGNPDDVRKISAAMEPNGACDELIFKAADAGQVNAFFVCPGGIYGTSANHVALVAGDAAKAAASVPGVWVGWMLGNVAELGFSPYVGEGTSVFRVIHVDDVVEMMMLVFAKALSTRETYRPEDVYRNFYLVVDEEIASKPMATAYAELLYRTGKIPEPLTKSVSYEEAGSTARYMAGNMLLIDDNARAIGWQPRALGLMETLRLVE